MTIKEAFESLAKVTSKGMKNPFFVMRGLNKAFGDIAANIEGGSSSYSTDEHIVGTWIDGSTLYEKTIAIDNIDVGYTNDIKTKIPHGINNLKEVISLNYSAPFFSKTGSNVVFAGTTSPSVLAYFIVTSSDIEAAGGTNYHSGAVGRYWYFTLQYTKN